MKKGDQVAVFFDQYGEQDFEGTFELIDKTFENDTVETWNCWDTSKPKPECPGQRVFYKKNKGSARSKQAHKCPDWKERKKRMQDFDNSIVTALEKATAAPTPKPSPALGIFKSAHQFTFHLLEQRKFTDQQIYKEVHAVFPKFKLNYVGIKRCDLNRDKWKNDPILKIVEE